MEPLYIDLTGSTSKKLFSSYRPLIAVRDVYLVEDVGRGEVRVFVVGTIDGRRAVCGAPQCRV